MSKYGLKREHGVQFTCSREQERESPYTSYSPMGPFGKKPSEPELPSEGGIPAVFILLSI